MKLEGFIDCWLKSNMYSQQLLMQANLMLRSLGPYVSSVLDCNFLIAITEMSLHDKLQIQCLVNDTQTQGESECFELNSIENFCKDVCKLLFSWDVLQFDCILLKKFSD